MKSLRNYTPQSNQTSVNDYMSMSEKELLVALERSVYQSKQNGTFNAEKIRSMIDLVAPKLTHEQVEKLYKILSDIT